MLLIVQSWNLSLCFPRPHLSSYHIITNHIKLVIEKLPDYGASKFGTARALAGQVTDDNYDKGLVYPPFPSIRKISAHIAADVAAKAYDLGEFHN